MQAQNPSGAGEQVEDRPPPSHQRSPRSFKERGSEPHGGCWVHLPTPDTADDLSNEGRTEGSEMELSLEPDLGFPLPQAAQTPVSAESPLCAPQQDSPSLGPWCMCGRMQLSHPFPAICPCAPSAFPVWASGLAVTPQQDPPTGSQDLSCPRAQPHPGAGRAVRGSQAAGSLRQAGIGIAGGASSQPPGWWVFLSPVLSLKPARFQDLFSP